MEPLLSGWGALYCRVFFDRETLEFSIDPCKITGIAKLYYNAFATPPVITGFLLNVFSSATWWCLRAKNNKKNTWCFSALGWILNSERMAENTDDYMTFLALGRNSTHLNWNKKCTKKKMRQKKKQNIAVFISSQFGLLFSLSLQLQGMLMVYNLL